jgi:hypothetical protein
VKEFALFEVFAASRTAFSGVVLAADVPPDTEPPDTEPPDTEPPETGPQAVRAVPRTTVSPAA